MKKLAAALIASLFATGAFAQASAPAETSAPAKASKVQKHKLQHHKKMAPAKPASGA